MLHGKRFVVELNSSLKGPLSVNSRRKIDCWKSRFHQVQTVQRNAFIVLDTLTRVRECIVRSDEVSCFAKVTNYLDTR